MRFHEEASLLPYHRSRNHQYRLSGYDRGHLAPAGDFSRNDREMRDTFVLTNVSPQAPRFNRSTWRQLEEFARQVAKEHAGDRSTTSETWVVTGPLWLPQTTTNADGSRLRYSHEALGQPPSVIAVPTHFYKVIAVVEHNERDAKANLTKFAAFVLPNSDMTGTSSIRLVDFTVRLTDLEAVTGLEFFPTLMGSSLDSSDAGGTVPLTKEIADALTDDVRLRALKNEKRSNDGDSSSLLMLSNKEEPSRERLKKMKRLLKENAPVSFQHICKENEACLKLLKL